MPRIGEEQQSGRFKTLEHENRDMSSYCGIILKGDEEAACALAFITEDGVTTYSTTDDEQIMEHLEEYRPQVVALNAPQEHVHDEELHQPTPSKTKETEETGPGSSNEEDTNGLDPATAQQFRSGEKELVEDGHSMLPTGMRDRRLLERAEFLSNSIKRSGLGSTIIESNPKLVAKKLDVSGDRKLEAYGIDTTDIENVYEFDAVLLALTAKFFDEDQYEDKDIILPKSLDEMD